MKLIQLATPSLVIDNKAMSENMKIMNELLFGTQLSLRPHYKSNKCSAIARRQIASGAKGITCAKISEAEDLVSCGIEDVLIANQVVEADKITRVAQLAAKCKLTICVDGFENADALSLAAVREGTTIYCYVEFEIGMMRCGVSDPRTYVALAKHVNDLPNLHYAGIQAYAGHVSHMVEMKEREQYVNDIFARVASLKKMLEDNGIKVEEISGGSTGTATLLAERGLYTELQAGSYLWLDSTYGELEKLPFKNAMYVLSSVVHKRPGLIVLDAGVKSFGVDQGLPTVMTMDGKIVSGTLEANEEHLKIFDPDKELSVGEKVLLIPGHCCSTMNLYNNIYLYEEDKIVDRYTVTARGCSI